MFSVQIYQKKFIELLNVSTIERFFESLVFNPKGLIKYVSLDNRLCQARPALVNTKFDETIYYQFTVSVNKCGRICNIIDHPYARVCVPNEVKNMNAKVFNLITEVNEARFLVQHESFECKCRSNEIACDSKQK